VRHEIGKDAYIHKTIVSYDGSPVWIEEVMEESYLVSPLSGRNRFEVKKKDRKLDVSSLEVGYLNLHPRAIYLMRSPVRAWKQGISKDSIYFRLDPDGSTSRGIDLLRYADEARAMFCGEYPIIDNAFHISADTGGITAFHRHMAVSGEGMLLYRHRTIGTYNREKGIELTDVFSYMREMINQEIGI
jgi:hypothetical protein